MNVDKIAQIIYDNLSYMYCDNCRYNSEIKEEDGCDDCHRKYNGWGISMATAKGIAEKIKNDMLDNKQVMYYPQVDGITPSVI